MDSVGIHQENRRISGGSRIFPFFKFISVLDASAQLLETGATSAADSGSADDVEREAGINAGFDVSLGPGTTPGPRASRSHW